MLPLLLDAAQRDVQPCTAARMQQDSPQDHQDDLIHTALMNLTFQGRFETMPARLKMRKMPLSIIRPLCMIEESDIKAFAVLRGYQKQNKLCPYENSSHRTDIKVVYEHIEKINPEARFSIWRALNADNKLVEE